MQWLRSVGKWVTHASLVTLLAGCGSAGTVGYIPAPGKPTGRLSIGSIEPSPMSGSIVTSLEQPSRYLQVSFTTPQSLTRKPRLQDRNKGQSYVLARLVVPASLHFAYDGSQAPAGLGDDAFKAVQRAAAAWNGAVGNDKCLAVTNSGRRRRLPFPDGQSTVFWSADPRDEAPVAKAVVWLIEDRIWDVDIVLNSTQPWAVNPPLNAGQEATGLTDAYDLQSALTHEFGHAIGLRDVTNQDKTVYATMNGEIAKAELCPQTLSEGDQAGALAARPK